MPRLFFIKLFIASPVYLLQLDALSFYAISTVDFSIPKYLLYSSQNIYIGKLSIIHLADVYHLSLYLTIL